MEQKFEAGINIAIKIPKRKYDETVDFYRNILKLEVKEIPIQKWWNIENPENFLKKQSALFLAG